jgi:hypothetical protein
MAMDTNGFAADIRIAAIRLWGAIPGNRDRARIELQRAIG